ncbi:MAG TPA: hypothetical protein VE959_31020 [Bryobacteraceae bacterium]|nr:hypothetical protein [Bryobacteraceae bacterium]
MEELRPLTPEQFARAAERLRHPVPGSRIAAARDYGISLYQLLEQLRLTPAERARNLETASNALEKVHGIARRRS